MEDGTNQSEVHLYCAVLDVTHFTIRVKHHLEIFKAVFCSDQTIIALDKA